MCGKRVMQEKTIQNRLTAFAQQEKTVGREEEQFIC